MDKKTVLARINKIKEISTPPTILQAILDLINSPDVSAKQLAETILKDPALTARVLKAANSSFYGYYKKITTVNQAVMVMGINAVKYFILSITVLNQLITQRDKSRINQKHIWTNILESATAAQEIAMGIRYPQPEEAYVAGLLHDLGIIILEKEFPDEYQLVLRLVAGGKQLHDAESEILGVDHQYVIGQMANNWNLPPLITDSIISHHPTDEAEVAKMPIISKIVALADCLASVPFDEMRNLTIAEKRLHLMEHLADSLKTDQDMMLSIHKKLAEKVMVTASTMDLEIGDAVEVLSRSNAELFKIYLELAALFKERRELSRQILQEERMEGTLESLKIALATLSHYINNATMNISGKCELIRLIQSQKGIEGVQKELPGFLSSIEKSLKRITLVLEHLSHISSIETLNFFSHSKAIDIENDIKNKLAQQLETIEAQK